ncbi:hypothetical protein CYFUS_004351 [Cystobacter fuscus]|uniref:Uncharacterized protein n=1 Tax=Cystobacter fuscus TaxID=43 RepID=A0A250J4R2_9BACT|nr:hypothetical protein [Cystobacter fuscus]ATB38914.1 hypothetical protein CYFUS_004351 [Cystobacter fuscus]
MGSADTSHQAAIAERTDKPPLQWEGDFDKPRVEWYVGVWEPTSSLRFVDVLILEEGPFSGRPPREVFFQ